MKKLLSLIAVFIGLNMAASAQDTTINNYAAVKVEPVRYSLADTTDITFVAAFLDFNDLHSYANVKCMLLDSEGRELSNRYFRLEAADYQSWPSAEYLFNFLLNKLGLTRDED